MRPGVARSKSGSPSRHAHQNFFLNTLDTPLGGEYLGTTDNKGSKNERDRTRF